MSDTHSDVTSVSEENLQREELGRTVSTGSCWAYLRMV